MDLALLKNLGVHEKVVRALEKTAGEKFEVLEIEQSASSLRLILRCRPEAGVKPHILTLRDFVPVPAAGTAEPEAAYAAGRREHYLCADRLHLFPQPGSGQANLAINGQKFRMGESLFRLLFHLAREMKSNGSGWISIQDLRQARCIPSDGYQAFSRLRSVVAGYLLKKNPREFLEANGGKQYRVSLPPENIDF
ncbi:MAG TPA: hypothetical protein VL688_06925 [Verrucomicrobiae bacterium]|jgi:hypothetical protein|nr:hypothetical protein [Verrucomicrobiae bacterium]